ncbi:pyridoxamine 5'-phosphate oxidase family protein [Corynebacterium mastitidis]|uniref:pyridoxamine 5'-phosphate oxidase family protein n=1 Tax=Corynebacterium mastitidis TaxID=161890 RepID=UPI00254E96F6|nr:pyridoxamine 5'-phosphate oxidase family protein [Corynebacterium mastitidis]MDK8451444.1 pyridoxamine 5'-phosphate oxidase family protein [Corynebacterium mastitidis]
MDYTEHLSALDVVRRNRLVMVTATNTDGALQTQPMVVQKITDEGTAWFFLNADSALAVAVQHTPQINVAVTEKGSWVSLAGTATITHDREKIDQLWSTSVESWFPQGKDDPSVVLLKFHAETAKR